MSDFLDKVPPLSVADLDSFGIRGLVTDCIIVLILYTKWDNMYFISSEAVDLYQDRCFVST